jgi:hypothetical protein
MKPTRPVPHLYHNSLKHRFNRDRFRTLIQYICWICDNPMTLGIHRLNFILWYSDRNVYLESGRPITGATYIRHHKGPQARPLQPMLIELEKEGAIARRTANQSGGFDFLFAIQRPNLSRFEPYEISIVEAATRAVCLEPRGLIPYQVAHDRVWQLAQIGELLPYFTVFAGHPGDILPADISWAMRELHPRDDGVSADQNAQLPKLIDADTTSNKCKEVIDAALWHLYRDPSIGISLPTTEASWFIYKQEGIMRLTVPDVTIVYTFDVNELSIAAIRLNNAEDDLDDEED